MNEPTTQTQSKEKQNNLPMTENVHNAEFCDWSLKLYVTCEDPTGKLSPGWCVLKTVGCPPELSIAVGSTQDTGLDVVPSGVV